MKLEGIYPAMVTPFDGAGEVDYAAFERLLHHAVDNGVAGIVPCGSTGEFYALSDTERDEVLAFVKRTVGDRVQLIAGTNAASTRDVLTYTRHALDLGYDAALLAPPYYSLPTQAELITHFETVLDTIDLPIVLYNFPGRAGVEIGYPVLDALADHPRLAAIKESSGDLSRLHEILARYAGRIQLVCGGDDQAFEYLAWGITSWVAGAASFAPRQHVEILAAMRTGDLDTARARWARFLPLLKSMEAGQYIQKAKYGCALAGVPAGDPRPPLRPLDEAAQGAFAEAFEAAMVQ